jgi:hypothetical protein
VTGVRPPSLLGRIGMQPLQDTASPMLRLRVSSFSTSAGGPYSELTTNGNNPVVCRLHNRSDLDRSTHLSHSRAAIKIRDAHRIQNA